MYRTKFLLTRGKLTHLSYSWHSDRTRKMSVTVETTGTVSSSPRAQRRDYVAELGELNGLRVHIADRERVNVLIGQIVTDGKDNLQVVSDFDRTITKQHDHGKVHLSSFGIFARCKSLPETYLESDKQLTDKYLPIEVDPSIPFEDKKELMEEWWHKSEKLLSGLKVSEEDIDEVVCKLGPSLRENTIEAFAKLRDLEIPVLVFSAGMGDTVVAVLKHFNVLFPNVQVISNFLKKDENGVIQGFREKLINVFNKNELAIKGTKYYDLVCDRNNVIVMGDSIGDAGMADGLPNANAVLKIGFLYDHIDGNLPKYKESFDIVLEDDQTMNVLNAILRLI